MPTPIKPTFNELFSVGRQLKLWLTPELGYERMYHVLSKAVEKIDSASLSPESYLILERAGLLAKVAAGVKDCYGSLYEEGNHFCMACGERVRCKEMTVNKAIGNGVAVVVLARRPRRKPVVVDDGQLELVELVRRTVAAVVHDELSVVMVGASRLTLQDYAVARFFLQRGGRSVPLFVLRNPKVPQQVRVLVVKPSQRLIENYGLMRDNVLRGWYWSGNQDEVSVLGRLVSDQVDELTNPVPKRTKQGET